ncbi:WAP, Kazal, immunoglobulin, Kunitz and NTR domain-containing protein 2-like [Leucoraja erinacea]|uniref:WAP, Kazal, immunoglobulin, Kunitz and NTR domain-containing protein 2-like n=1 Tax=Leucoraja erinaceus TaxID=7782 RepID=UPI002457F2AF|nr:WAP, Kazal, immunoglobulin, Kunitz and NTR domain-containing protein 2-like [Leucoraja erinacea]
MRHRSLSPAAAMKRVPLAALLLLLLPPAALGVPATRIKYSHAGICPNEMTPSLWVDAQSTCSRECETDQDCETFEKCCPNVCGSRSCVASRYMALKGGRGPASLPRGASCDRFMCAQQGSECDVWDGQPVCKCRDRCEKEPRFTCASDGLTYYNKCYMDAEACGKGITLTVVTCTHRLAGGASSSSSPLPPPHTSPATASTSTGGPGFGLGPGPAAAATTHPGPGPLTTTTPVSGVQAPALLATPARQSIYAGGTVSFLCAVSGRPRPDISWERQRADGPSVVLRPNHVQGNMVVTNIGQLVIYSARTQDAGTYTCTARNAGGAVSAHFPLSVIKRAALQATSAGSDDPRRRHHGNASLVMAAPARECLRRPEDRHCAEARMRWFYDARKNNCFTFGLCGSDGDDGGGGLDHNYFASYEACMGSCMSEPVNACGLPALQGGCRVWEPRWAYSGLHRQCQPFIYGGCGGNENNFESRETCEEICPYPRSQQCKACKPRFKIVTSFCKSDYVIVGRLSELAEEADSGRALFTVERVLKDEKMGLQFFGSEVLEITLLNMDWGCPCPNMTTEDGPLIVMGDVHNGMATLQPHSFVKAVNDKRIKKLAEVKEKKTCDLLRELTGLQ